MESLFTMYMCQWVSLDVIIQFVQVHIFVKAIRENINYNVRLISVILYTWLKIHVKIKAAYSRRVVFKLIRDFENLHSESL